MEENVASHVALFETENWKNVSAEVDLGLPWQAGFAAALLKSGFMPRLILPHAGQGDVILFRRPPVLNTLVPGIRQELRALYPQPSARRAEEAVPLRDPLPPEQQRKRPGAAGCGAAGPAGFSALRRHALPQRRQLPPAPSACRNTTTSIPISSSWATGPMRALRSSSRPSARWATTSSRRTRPTAAYEWVARFSGIGGEADGPEGRGLRCGGHVGEESTAGRRSSSSATPNNPTGTYWTRQELTGFLDRVAGRCIVVLDRGVFRIRRFAGHPRRHEAHRDVPQSGDLPDLLQDVRSGRAPHRLRRRRYRRDQHHPPHRRRLFGQHPGAGGGPGGPWGTKSTS